MANYSDRTNAALGVALRRQYLSPLDVSAVFRCLADFEAYVQRNVAYTNADYDATENTFLQKINPYCYDGQIVAVLDETAKTAKAYIINKAGALEDGETIEKRYSEIGGNLTGDGKTIEITNGVIMLAGLGSVPAERTKAYQPTLNPAGNIVWAEVSETTIEGLQTIVAALQERVSTLETDVSDIKANYLKSVEYVPGTGVFTFTKQDGTTQTMDLAIEKVVTYFQYNEETKALDLTLADGTIQSVPMSGFIDDYTAAPNAVQIQLEISDSNVISASLVDGGISEAKLDAGLKEKIAVGQTALDGLASKADASVVEELTTKVGELETSVGESVTADDVNLLIDAASIKGEKVTGAVAEAKSAQSADKVVGELTFGSKTYNGSAAREITADDLGVSIIGKTGNLSDVIEDAEHRVVTDAEKAAWNAKQDAITFDSAPTEGSNNAVTSGGVFAADKANADAIVNITNGTTKVGNAAQADSATSADSAVKLSSARTISISGDATGSASFDGSENKDIVLSLSESGVSEGSYSAVSVDKKGRVIAGAQLIEVGEESQEEPGASLATGGIFFRQL